MRMCFDKRVLAGLGLVVGGLLALSPQTLGAALPLLVMAACPLSMVLMMRTMSGGRDRAADDVDSGIITASDVPVGDDAKVDRGAEVRELEEEVNRLRAELRLRDEHSVT